MIEPNHMREASLCHCYRRLFLVLFLLPSVLLETSIQYAVGDYRYISYEEVSRNSKFRHPDLVGIVPLTVDKSNNQLLIGARNGVFRLSLNNLTFIEHADWTPSETTRDLCRNKGLPKTECDNFVRVLIVHNDRLLTCGTNAYSPMCCWRNTNSLKQVYQELNGKQKCPYNPRQNSTAIMTKDGNLYTGTVMDIQSRDHAISRVMGPLPILRTLRSNSKWLNEPNFVSSYEIDSYIYFFFRETAVEHINCGKKVYSRIARICKTDRGGDSLLLENNWTTFLKSRINCSLAGEFPFYFDEIQGTYYSREEKKIYAVFGTGENSIPGSAVCVYTLDTFHKSFIGAFKYQRDAISAWTRMENHKTDSQCPSPGSSSKRSYSNHISQVLLDAQKYQMMNDAVQPISTMPAFYAGGQRWTHIVVDTVYALKGKFSVVFVGTTEGIIKKMLQIPSKNLSCVLEEIRVTPEGKPVPVMAMVKSKDQRAVYVGVSPNVFKIPFERCHRLKTKSMCIQARDPYCAWNSINKTCASPPRNELGAHYWLQDITSCPVLETPVDGKWSPWSEWRQCKLMGNDRLGDDCWCRTRACDNPKPRLGGRDCAGDMVEVTNCTTHGGWTPWSPWTSCSHTCNTGMRSRTRTCGNPVPLHGGRECEGPARQEEFCPGNPRCPYSPVNGHWSMWSSWAGCSERCYGGVQTRRRNCDNPPPRHNGIPCIGNTQEWRLCNNHNCAAKSKIVPWSEWIKTNTTRGGYFEQRLRFSCSAPVPDRHMIQVKHMKSQVRFCFDNGVCHKSGELRNPVDTYTPVDRVLRKYCLETEPSSWTQWSKWSRCGSPCGGGLQFRERTCNLHAFHLNTCDGHSMEARPCNSRSCHDKSNSIPWSVWSPCQPEGIRYRYKICTIQAKGKQLCQGNDIEMVTCFLQGLEKDYIQDEQEVTFALIHLVDVGMIGLTVGAIVSGSILHHIQKCQADQKRRSEKRKNEKNEYMNNAAVAVPPFLMSGSQASLHYLNNAPSPKNTRIHNPHELGLKEIGTLKRNCELRTNLALNDL